MYQHYTTGAPVPFECLFAIEVIDCTKVESALHIAFSPYRVNPSREFFKIDAEQAIAILTLLGQKDITPQVSEELNSNVSQAEKDSGKKLQRKPNMDFLVMNIPIGSELLFEDGVTKVEVYNNKKVKCNEIVSTLTRATRNIMGIDYLVQPSPHWTYSGRLLKDIYDEVYSDDDEENN